MEQRLRREPEPRRLASLKPDDIGHFAGWRIRVYSAGLSLRMTEEMEEQRRLILAKPQTLVASDYGEKDRYRAIATKYEQATGKNIMPVGGFTFGGELYLLLEPLSEDELKEIDETSSATSDKPHVILPPQELREILEIPSDSGTS